MYKVILKLILLGGFVAILCLVYGFFIEPKLTKIRYHSIASPNYTYSQPFKIAVVADFHIGGMHVDGARIEDIVRRVNELKPDMILIAGNHMSEHMDDIAYVLR